jgi:lycopene cyclase domain-containing protein
MFERWSYLGYTLIFCLPPLVTLWMRQEFARRLAKDLYRILAATAILTLYGSIMWPMALRAGAWAYADNRILNIKLLGYVHFEDTLWWLLVSFLMASFVSLSIRYEDEGVDIFAREIQGLLRSFACALRRISESLRPGVVCLAFGCRRRGGAGIAKQRHRTRRVPADSRAE